MKDKPVKTGIKLLVCDDTATAYSYNLGLYVYRQTRGTDHQSDGLSARVVIALTKPVHSFGHIVFTIFFFFWWVVGGGVVGGVCYCYISCCCWVPGSR